MYSLESPHRDTKYFAILSGTMINHQWLELPISRISYHGPKDFRAIEVRVYLSIYLSMRRYRCQDWLPLILKVFSLKRLHTKPLVNTSVLQKESICSTPKSLRIQVYSKRKAFAPPQSLRIQVYSKRKAFAPHQSPCEYKCTLKGKHLLHTKVLANTCILQKESICSPNPCEYKCTLK